MEFSAKSIYCYVFGCMMGRFGQCNGPFWTIFLEIKILGAVLVGAVLAMGLFGIDPVRETVIIKPSRVNIMAQGLSNSLPHSLP